MTHPPEFAPAGARSGRNLRGSAAAAGRPEVPQTAPIRHSVEAAFATRASRPGEIFDIRTRAGSRPRSTVEPAQPRPRSLQLVHHRPAQPRGRAVEPER